MPPQGLRQSRELETLTPQERLDALAEVFAEGIACLAETGQLRDFAAGYGTLGESGDLALTSGGNEGTPSCDARGAEDGRKKIGGGCGGG